MNKIIVEMDKNGKISKNENTIGYTGENKATEVWFKIDDEILIDAVNLEIQQGKEKYLIELSSITEDEQVYYVLPVLNSLLTTSVVQMNLRINGTGENQVIKSEVFKFNILGSINAVDVIIPEEYPSVIEELQDDVEEINENLTVINSTLLEKADIDYVDPNVVTSTDSTYTISSLVGNKVYKLSTLTSLTITAVTTFDKESVIYFTSDSTNVSIPDTLVNIGDVPTLTTSSGVNTGTCEASKSYIIAVLNGIAVWKAY